MATNQGQKSFESHDKIKEFIQNTVTEENKNGAIEQGAITKY
jgi:hypothetical protein